VDYVNAAYPPYSMRSPFFFQLYFYEYGSGQKNFLPAKNLAEREDGRTLCASGGLGRV